MKRFKTILKWIGITMGVVIPVLLVLNAYFVWSTGTRLEERLSTLRQAGEPLQLSDLTRREPLSPEKNADTFLNRAANDLEAIEKELGALYPKKGYPSGDLTPDDQKKLEALFNAYPKVMPLLEQAAACPDFDPELDTTVTSSRFLGPYMAQVQKLRSLMRMSWARSTWLLSKGRGDDALAGQIMMLRLAWHWRREPLLIGYLVTGACEDSAMAEAGRILCKGPVSTALRQELDQELARHDSTERYTWALRSERAFSLSSFREYPGAGTWLSRGLINDAILSVLDLYESHLNSASEPYPMVKARWKSDTVSGMKLNPYRTLATLLQPALAAARPPMDRVRAMSRALRVLNALQTHASTNVEKAPELSDLGLPESVTTDPFSEKPLLVKKLPAGWIVYSVGDDGVDDGGVFEKAKDVGVGPIERK